ncbi:hypothetical protein BCR44DRAFT_35696, partial [Catenaria anguillulae PL171]
MLHLNFFRLRSHAAITLLVPLMALILLVTSSPIPEPEPRTIPKPVVASSIQYGWCCRERGVCVRTQCPQRVVRGIRWFGGYRTQNSCISARCRGVCVLTTRNKCQFFF